jgi:hypothetical protein
MQTLPEIWKERLLNSFYEANINPIPKPHKNIIRKGIYFPMHRDVNNINKF